jgi:outer membrane protein OmpA-like peptidoglycan-associated protein
MSSNYNRTFKTKRHAYLHFFRHYCSGHFSFSLIYHFMGIAQDTGKTHQMIIFNENNIKFNIMKKNIKRSLYMFILCAFSITNINSQTPTESFEKDFKEAEEIYAKYYVDNKGESMSYSKGGFSAAAPLFLKLYKSDTTNMNLAFKLGVCYQSSRRKKAECIYYFSKASSSISMDYKGGSYKERKAPVLAIKFLADAYHLNYEFDKAIKTYQRFITVMKQNNMPGKIVMAEALHQIEVCKTAKILVANPINIKIETLGNSLNSPYADYAPVISADQNTIFFTTTRIETKGDIKDEGGNFMEDIYMSKKVNSVWSTAKSIGVPINTDKHEASVGISSDGQTILIYKDDEGDGNIYSTSLEGNVWSVPVKLNDNINSKHWEPSAAISTDGSKLYFTSDRPGGFGGSDLYCSNRKPNGEWGKSENMGATINTMYNEDAPFIHPDGVTFAFSSNGHNTMGGFDVFTSICSAQGVWSKPMNVGYPINTTDDDIYYVLSPDNKTAYFTSFREGGIGEKDNYTATFIDRKPTPLTLIKGNVIMESGIAAKNIEILITDNETETVLGSYRANSATGEFIFILVPGKNYNITYQSPGHLFYSENIEIPVKSNYYEIYKPVTLDPITVGSKIILNNIFFDFDKANLRPLSNVELKNLVSLLKANPNMKVEIAGHTDSKGDDIYNQKLSEERAQAVVNKLIANGISPDQMTAKGYGKSMPYTSNKKMDGTDSPYGRQLNRRVELKIIEIK